MDPLFKRLQWLVLAAVLALGAFALFQNCSNGFYTNAEFQKSVGTSGSGGGGSSGSGPGPGSGGGGSGGGGSGFTEVDPGFGFWAPKTLNKVYVVDEGKIPNFVETPGGIMGREGTGPSSPYYCVDYYQEAGSPILSHRVGLTISMRVRTPAVPTGAIKFSSCVGSSAQYPIDVSLSEVPGDFSDPACTIHLKSAPTFYIGIGMNTTATRCTPPANKLLYLNFRATENKFSLIQADPNNPGYNTFTPVSEGDCTRSDISCPSMKVQILWIN